MLFLDTQFVIIYYNNAKKLVQSARLSQSYLGNNFFLNVPER